MHKLLIALVFIEHMKCIEQAQNCRSQSNHIRQDGGLCFEIPSWQHQAVELDQHITNLKSKWGDSVPKLRRQVRGQVLTNSEVSRYMDTVIAPFLDTYHRNIQNSYQQLTSKILKRIKEEISAAVLKKKSIYVQLTKLADDLQVPDHCDEERRASRTLASKHVADIYKCTEDARASIAKMGTYADDMIKITRNHMHSIFDEASKIADSGSSLTNTNISSCIKDLSKAAVLLGYELDLSLTNARRHNEHSCEKLTSCSTKTKKSSEEEVAELSELLNQCVYA